MIYCAAALKKVKRRQLTLFLICLQLMAWYEQPEHLRRIGVSEESEAKKAWNKSLWIKISIALFITMAIAGTLIGLAVYFHRQPKKDGKKKQIHSSPQPITEDTIVQPGDQIQVRKKFKLAPVGKFDFWSGRNFTNGEWCTVKEIDDGNDKIYFTKDGKTFKFSTKDFRKKFDKIKKAN